MKHSVKKMTSMLLSIIMVFSVCFAPAYATESTQVSAISASYNEVNLTTLVAYSDDYTEIFNIPICYDPTSNAVYNLEVSLTGDEDSRTVAAACKNGTPFTFNKIEMEIGLFSERSEAICRGTLYSKDLGFLDSLTVFHSGITESAKYYAVVAYAINGGRCIYYRTPGIPFNKKAKKYPTSIVSYVTGQSLPYDFPMDMPSVPKEDRVIWTSSIRNTYAGDLGADLNGLHVHHIIPKQYGGTNDYRNLIPLKVEDHKKVSAWWSSY